jgi:hypothetical protein
MTGKKSKQKAALPGDGDNTISFSVNISTSIELDDVQLNSLFNSCLSYLEMLEIDVSILAKNSSFWRLLNAIKSLKICLRNFSILVEESKSWRFLWVQQSVQ